MTPSERLTPFLSNWAKLATVLTSLSEDDLTTVVAMEKERTVPRNDIIERCIARFNVIRDARERSEMLSSKAVRPEWMAPGMAMSLGERQLITEILKNQETLLKQRDSLDELTTLRLICEEWSKKNPRLALLERLKAHFNNLRREREAQCLKA